jgi:hypothetical protein
MKGDLVAAVDQHWAATEALPVWRGRLGGRMLDVPRDDLQAGES